MGLRLSSRRVAVAADAGVGRHLPELS
jgi:hypothetical protein